MKIIPLAEIAQYVGVAAEPTDWFVVQQGQIDQFAECTKDQYFIHVDPEKAKDTVFGSTIAHGLLSLSMLPYFAESFSFGLEGTAVGVNYGFDSVRFIQPVKVNSRIRAHAKILSIEEKKPRQYLFRTEVLIEIEGDERPALKAVWLSMQMLN